MSRRDDHEAGRARAEPNATQSEDAFAPGGEPRTGAGTDDVAAVDAGHEAGDAAAVEDVPGGEVEEGGEVAGSLLQRHLDEQRDRYLRLAAEYDNYRKRTQRERTEAGARAQAELVKQLLEPLDDLDRSVQVDAAAVTAASVVEGVEMVRRKLSKALAAAGLEVVDPVGQPFDPSLHEALTTMPAASAEEDDTVGQVYQPGYVFRGQLIRPARVVVRQWNG